MSDGMKEHHGPYPKKKEKKHIRCEGGTISEEDL